MADLKEIQSFILKHEKINPLPEVPDDPLLAEIVDAFAHAWETSYTKLVDEGKGIILPALSRKVTKAYEGELQTVHGDVPGLTPLWREYLKQRRRHFLYMRLIMLDLDSEKDDAKRVEYKREMREEMYEDLARLKNALKKIREDIGEDYYYKLKGLITSLLCKLHHSARVVDEKNPEDLYGTWRITMQNLLIDKELLETLGKEKRRLYYEYLGVYQERMALLSYTREYDTIMSYMKAL